MNSAAPAPVSAPIALTMGEPAGIGPELAIRLYRERKAHAVPPFVYLGCAAQLRNIAPEVRLQVLTSALEATEIFDHALPVLEQPLAVACLPGRPDPLNASAVLGAIEKGVELAQSGQVRALVTNPIHKAVLKQAGFAFAGHTDYLAHLTGIDAAEAVMVLAGQELRVACVTHHIPLRQVPDALSIDRITLTGRILALGLSAQFRIENPRIAVTGLNPHAGEEGNIGSEDAEIIAPAIQKLKDAGINAYGPCPADSLFQPMMRSNYDAALCMYHDQALIAVKSVCGMAVANITLGLPIIRTSPGHGTALDLAGTGAADLSGLLAAFEAADRASKS